MTTMMWCAECGMPKRQGQTCPMCGERADRRYPPDASECRALLTMLADERRAAEDRRAAGIDAIRSLIGPARDAGLTISEIARLADLTRQTIYDLSAQPSTPPEGGRPR
jgi:hypothetical protein